MNTAQEPAGQFLPLDRESGQPLHQQITWQLQRRIEHGDFPPGSQLPSVSAMSTTFGVSMMTVHAGLQPLRNSGVIRSAKGRGLFVRDAVEGERVVMAYLRDDQVRTAGVPRTVFVRLVPAGTVAPSSTVSTDAMVDLDRDGNVMGITVFLQN